VLLTASMPHGIRRDHRRCSSDAHYAVKLASTKKCWQTGKADDLSLRGFITLAVGVALWLGYGALKADRIIMAANIVSLALLCGILFFKIRGATTRGSKQGAVF